MRQQIEWAEASQRKLSRLDRPTLPLDRDDRGDLIVWRENRTAALIWLAIARWWQMGAAHGHPITGLDLGLALTMADRMAAEYPEMLVPTLQLVSDLKTIEEVAVSRLIEWSRSQQRGAG